MRIGIEIGIRIRLVWVEDRFVTYCLHCCSYLDHLTMIVWVLFQDPVAIVEKDLLTLSPLPPHTLRKEVLKKADG